MVAEHVMRQERRILAFTAVGHFFTHFTILVFPALVTTVARDLGVELHVVFRVSLLMYLLYGLGSLPWGYMADNWSYRKVLAAGMFMASAGLIAAGLARNIFILSMALGAVGLGNASYHPAGIALLSKGFRNRGQAMGFNGIFGNIGIAMGPLGAGLLASFFGWRNGLILIGVFGLAVTSGMLVLPFDAGRYEDRQKVVGTKGQRVLLLFGILCLTVMFSGLGYRSFTLGLPAWVENGLSDNFDSYIQALFPDSRMRPRSFLAAGISGISMLFGIFGQLFGGRVADSRNLAKGYGFFFGLAMLCLIALQLFGGWRGSLIFLAAFSFFILGAQPVENSLYAMLLPARWRSSGFGIKFTLAFGVGSMAVPILARQQEIWGIGSLMIAVSFYFLLAFCTIGMLNFLTRGKGLRHI